MWQSFTCVAGVGLGGQGGCVGHGCAKERRRVVDVDLEPVHVALVQVVDLRWIKVQCTPHKGKYLGIKVIYPRRANGDSSVFELESFL